MIQVTCNNRSAKWLLIALAALLSLSGCIWEDLDECPPIPPVVETGIVWLNPTFTLHNQKDDGGTYQDLFAEYARGLEVFIFDAEGRFVKKIIDTKGPFNTGYRMPIELMPGEYRAITWVNLSTEPALKLQSDPQPGITTIDQLRVQLTSLAEGTMSGQLQSLFYGDTPPFTIEKETGYDKDIDIPCSLVRNTKRVHVAIAWRDKKTKELCPHWMHADSTRMYIDDINGSLGFDNNIADGGNITYIPHYLNRNIANSNGSAAILHAEFDKLRLLTTSVSRLRICRLQPDGSEKIVYEKDLMKDFFAHLYKTQEALDREDFFRIDLEFMCEHIDKPVDPDPTPDPDPDPDPDPTPDPDPDPTPDPTPDPDPDEPTPPPTPGNESWTAIKIVINGWTLINSGDVDL